MSKGTVTITVEEYNRLKDLEFLYKEEGCTVSNYSRFSNHLSVSRLLGKDSVILELITANRSLQSKITDLEKEVNILNVKIIEQKLNHKPGFFK